MSTTARAHQSRYDVFGPSVKFAHQSEQAVPVSGSNGGANEFVLVLPSLRGFDLATLRTLEGLELKHPDFGRGPIINVSPPRVGQIDIVVDFQRGRRFISSDQLGDGELLVVRNIEMLDPMIRREIEKPGSHEANRLAEAERNAAEDLAEKRNREKREQAASKAEFAQLQSKWSIRGLADNSPSNPLFGILKRRDFGKQLRKQDIEIVRKQQQYDFAANWHREQYQQFGGSSSLAALGSDLRHCGKSCEAVEIISQEVQSKGIKSVSVITTLGAALADEGNLQDAEKWALKALELEVTFHPHNLLGRVYFRTGEFARSECHFEKACVLDPQCNNIRYKIEPEIREMRKYDADAARRAADWLLQIDQGKYSWAKQYV